jgi:hypothetical protein
MNEKNSNTMQAIEFHRSNSNPKQQQQQQQQQQSGHDLAITVETLSAVASKKLAVGKSLTELFEENADSVLGLACASGYIDLVSALLDINANLSGDERNSSSSASTTTTAANKSNNNISKNR